MCHGIGRIFFAQETLARELIRPLSSRRSENDALACGICRRGRRLLRRRLCRSGAILDGGCIRSRCARHRYGRGIGFLPLRYGPVFPTRGRCVGRNALGPARGVLGAREKDSDGPCRTVCRQRLKGTLASQCGRARYPHEAPSRFLQEGPGRRQKAQGLPQALSAQEAQGGAQAGLTWEKGGSRCRRQHLPKKFQGAQGKAEAPLHEGMEEQGSPAHIPAFARLPPVHGRGPSLVARHRAIRQPGRRR